MSLEEEHAMDHSTVTPAGNDDAQPAAAGLGADAPSARDSGAHGGGATGPGGRVVVIIPTYNELETLPVTLAKLRAAVPYADVLIVDDGSPDGTGDLADARARSDNAVHVMHRSGKMGLGTAYIAGFAWALERGYETICEMDADGSHQPEQLPQLLEALEADPKAGLALGSRWVPGGAVVNWPKSREVLSRGANVYTRIMLGLRVRDATGGFRAFRASALSQLAFDDVSSQGYCFQVDMTLRIDDLGLTIVEVPITFVERTAGESKMSRNIIGEALWRVTVWGVRRRSSQISELILSS